MQIKNRFTDEIIYEDDSTTMKECVENAIKKAAPYRADLTDANLTRANLTDADLTRADLTRANLTRADLTRADLTDADLTDADLTRADLTDANLTRADLTDANLTDADLRGFKADLWLTLTEYRKEIPALVSALREGRVNGSTYSDGECGCLIGTIGIAQGIDPTNLPHNSSHPAERWFLMIRKGDKPGDATGGGFASGVALEWVLEYCNLTGIQIDKPEKAA
jgi:uncharacterized protein YjbI with pentapeptide repeats